MIGATDKSAVIFIDPQGGALAPVEPIMAKLDSDRFRLPPGAAIGVAAPAGPFDEALFAAGVSILEGMGFAVRVDPRIRARAGFLAGEDRQRAAVLHALFEDAGIAAIVCARGGYGSLRLLPFLNADLIARNPKPVIGFSDITALLAFLSQRCRVPVVHGPVVTSLATSDAATVASLENLLSGAPVTVVAERPDVIEPGRAAGPVMGGNLTTLNHLLATGYMPDLGGGILLLEDIHEAPYRLDRMLCQMRLAGCFEDVAGLVLGTFETCGAPEQVREVFMTHFAARAIPVMGGFPIGHGAANRALPLGVPAVLDTASGSLRIDFADPAGA